MHTMCYHIFELWFLVRHFVDRFLDRHIAQSIVSRAVNLISCTICWMVTILYSSSSSSSSTYSIHFSSAFQFESYHNFVLQYCYCFVLFFRILVVVIVIFFSSDVAVVAILIRTHMLPVKCCFANDFNAHCS